MSHALVSAWEKTLRRRAAVRAITHAADGQSWSFSALDRRAAAWLRAHAPSPAAALAGRAVVFAAPNGIGWLEIFLGLLRAGAVAVPLDAAEPPAAQRSAAQAMRAGFWWDGRQLVALAGARRYRDPEVCLIKLTSGTAGQPRPLIFTAAQILADARQVTATMGISDGDVNYGLIPLGHSYGLGNLTVPLIAHGVPMVCGTAPLPHAVASDFRRWRPSVFPSVPALWGALAAAGVEPAALASLRLAVSAGAPLPIAVARDFANRFGRRLHNFYGSSETGGISFDRTGTATLAGGVGSPLRGVKTLALSGRRIRVCSPAVFTRGNRQSRGPRGCWTPPDRVAIDSRGRVTLLGRRGTTVKIAGRRVNLTEVETRLRKLAGVKDVWVGAGASAHPVLGAVLVTERPTSELRAELQDDTAAWKIPKKWLAVRAFPMNARGKTDTRQLRARLFA